MSVAEIEEQFKTLKENIKKYYTEMLSKQKKDIVLGESDILVDYLVYSLGTYEEAYINRLTSEHILVYDRSLGEDVVIDFDQLTIQDRIQVLEIYEQKLSELC